LQPAVCLLPAIGHEYLEQLVSKKIALRVQNDRFYYAYIYTVHLFIIRFVHEVQIKKTMKETHRINKTTFTVVVYNNYKSGGSNAEGGKS